MNTLTKSPVRVALAAWTAAQLALPRYAHRSGPKKYSQPQLVAASPFHPCSPSTPRNPPSPVLSWLRDPAPPSRGRHVDELTDRLGDLRERRSPPRAAAAIGGAAEGDDHGAIRDERETLAGRRGHGVMVRRRVRVIRWASGTGTSGAQGGPG